MPSISQRNISDFYGIWMTSPHLALLFQLIKTQMVYITLWIRPLCDQWSYPALLINIAATNIGLKGKQKHLFLRKSIQNTSFMKLYLSGLLVNGQTRISRSFSSKHETLESWVVSLSEKPLKEVIKYLCRRIIGVETVRQTDRLAAILGFKTQNHRKPNSYFYEKTRYLDITNIQKLNVNENMLMIIC